MNRFIIQKFIVLVIFIFLTVLMGFDSSALSAAKKGILLKPDLTGSFSKEKFLMARHRGGIPHGLMHSEGFRGLGVCPQPRSTPNAPDKFLKIKNPLKSIRSNILGGKELFHFEAQPTACKICHGIKGNGLGIMAQGALPMPRNFTCKETMKDISDGQIFYIITHGSQGTTMPAFRNLSDEQVWQLVTYIRTLAK